jgi:PAS domain S-box-containing protein
METKNLLRDISKDKYWLEESLKLAHIGNWQWDIATDTVTWSDELFRIYGLNQESFKASFYGYLERIHPEDQNRVKSIIENALQTKKQTIFEESIVRPNNEIRHLRSWASVIINDEKQPVKMYGACIDVTDSKIKEIELAKRDKEYKTILDRVSDAFVALDKNWIYTYVNKKAAETFGRQPEDLIGKHIWTEFPEDVGQSFYKAYYRAMETQKYEYIQAYYPPYDVWFESHIYPSPDGLTIYFADVTERKKTEEKLKSYNAHLEKEVTERTSDLEAQNALIKDQKTQIENIIKELHHRVKNNMQIITSLMRLQAEKIEDSEAKGFLIDCQNRVFSMSLIHEKMYQSKNLTQINAKEYFPELITDIIESLNINKKITTDFKIDSVDMSSKTLVPLGLLVNEIVLNSMKHAFTNANNGKIIFHLLKLSGGKFKVIIGDNGSGIKASVNKKTSGLGMELIDSFVNQLDATIKLTDVKGTLYEINLTAGD